MSRPQYTFRTFRRQIFFICLILLLGAISAKAQSGNDKNASNYSKGLIASAGWSIITTDAGLYTLKLKDSASNVDLVVYNQNGNISYVKSIVTANNKVIPIDLRDELAPGNYYLRVNSGSNTIIEKIVLQ